MHDTTTPRRVRRRQHAILASTFSAALVTMPLVARKRGVRGCDTPFEWAKLALATYAASRVVAREKVGDFIREPLEEADGAWTEAIAELVTCTRCVGIWSGAALNYMRVLAPSHASLAIDVLSVAGANNFLQAAFTHLAESANVTAAEAEVAAAAAPSSNGNGTASGSALAHHV